MSAGAKPPLPPMLDPPNPITPSDTPATFTAAFLRQDETTAKMKLNVKNIRYLVQDDWRVLTAVCACNPSFSAVHS